MYRVGEFASLTGVSVRTLHHYDRIGLLKPTGRSEAGYRLYSQEDLLRLQQILTLRYFGFPLKQIKELLAKPDFSIAGSMQIQRIALREQIAELQQIEAALGELVESRLASGQWDWDMVTSVSARLQGSLAQKGEKIKEFYTQEQLEQFEELAKQVSLEEIQQIQEQWAALVAEVQANRHIDPASPKAQEFADRWDKLTQATFRGNRKLMTTVGENYAQGRFNDMPGVPQPEDFAFIARVNEARKGHSGSSKG